MICLIQILKSSKLLPGTHQFKQYKTCQLFLKLRSIVINIKMNYEQTDVVFVIEKSITLKRYLNELLESYITPAISFFSGGISEENDVFFTQSSVVQYALVFFGSELTVLGSSTQVETQGPTTSQLSILNAIKDANYCYKNTCRQAYILEALQTAAEVFKSLSGGNIQKDSIKRCLVLVTQSTPINNPWASSTPENILQELKRIGVKTSIISAHKLVELYRLFESAGGDHQSMTMKNYASKPQHLVLLNGFTLQERAVSPSLISQPTIVNQSHMGIPTASTGPSPNTASHNRPTPSPGQPHTGSPAPPQQQPTQVTMIRSPVVMNPTPSPQAIPTPQVPGGLIRTPVVQNTPLMPNAAANITVNTRPNNRWQLASGTMMVQNPQAGMQNPQIQQVPQQSQTQNTQMSQAGTIQQVQGMANQVQMNLQMNQPRTGSQNIIWQGTLEWSEKKHMPGGGNALQTIPCKITYQPLNGKLEIKADGWPSTLQMLLVQKQLLSSVGNTYFQNNHKVLFFPEPCPALESLTASLSQGFAGCVHLSSRCSDVKMIILLFSPDKRAYVGFIPLDQVAFVSKLKQVFQSQSRNMQSQTMNKQNVANTMIQAVNQQVGVSSQNMQMIANPSAMNVSQSNMMMSQNQINASIGQQGGMSGANPMVSGVSQVGTSQVNQMGPTQGQGMSMGQSQPMTMGTHVSQGTPVGSQIGPSQAVLGNKLIRPPLNISGQQQQQQQQPTDQMQMRQPLHQPNIRQQIQLQQQRPPIQVNLAQPRMITTQMRHILQQRLQQQQQQQQQQQMLMIQQQNMRPQMNQAQQVMGQQVMGQQTMGQQTMGQQGMAQQGMGQQALGQQSLAQQGMGQQTMAQQTLNQGMGQPMQDSTTDYMDLL